MSTLDSATPPASAAAEMGTAEGDSTTASAPALNGTRKPRKRYMKRKNKTHELPPDLDSTAAAEAGEQAEAKGNEVEEQYVTNDASVMEGTLKCQEDDANVEVNLMPKKEANTFVVSGRGMSCLDSTTQPAAAAIEIGMAVQDTTTTSVSALNGTAKCKKKRNRNRNGRNKNQVQQELPSNFDSTAAAEAGEQVEAKGNEVEEQEVPDAVASVMEGTPKCHEEDAKVKVSLMPKKEANTSVVSGRCMSNLDSTTPPAAASVEMGTTEQDTTITYVSSLNGTAKRKKRKRKNKTQEQQELPPDFDSTAAAAEAGEQVEAKGNKVEEQEVTDAAASVMKGTPKCHEDSKVKISLMPEKEANASVISESTPKRKKRKKKKNQMKEQLDSEKASSGGVAVDIVVADKCENGCTDVGALGHADVNIDSINGDGPNSVQSKANGADVLLNNDGNKGDMNCAQNSGLLQEGSAGRKRQRGKRKWDSANGGPCFPSDNEGVVAKRALHSSANHGLSCICASCLVEAHKENIQNIYSPRGSLVRFQRKKLLILDLNGLLADINQDYHNAHLAHAKVRTKLVFKRPHCDDFLRFCFQNFELGVWSSRKRENVQSVVDILMRDFKQYLLFCWPDTVLGHEIKQVAICVVVLLHFIKIQWLGRDGCQASQPMTGKLSCFLIKNTAEPYKIIDSCPDSHLTCSSCHPHERSGFGCKTVDNKDKPLVLKELKKVWNKAKPNLPWKQGEFSPSNTLLVDDSPYKALCNPPNTAIFPEPYSYLNQKDDYSLGPGGDLRVYLQRIAAADNVQNFVRDNPFGQKSITESDPNWNFYVKIVDQMGSKQLMSLG